MRNDVKVSIDDLVVDQEYTIWQQGNATLHIKYKGDLRFWVINGEWNGFLLPPTKTILVRQTGAVIIYEKITKGDNLCKTV